MKTRWSKVFTEHTDTILEQMSLLIDKGVPELSSAFSGFALFTIAPNGMIWEVVWSADSTLSNHDWDDKSFVLSLPYNAALPFVNIETSLSAFIFDASQQLQLIESNKLLDDQQYLLVQKQQLIDSGKIDSLGVDDFGNPAELCFAAILDDLDFDSCKSFPFETVQEATGKGLELQKNLSPFDLFNKAISVCLIFCNRLPDGGLKPWFESDDGEHTYDRVSFELYGD